MLELTIKSAVFRKPFGFVIFSQSLLSLVSFHLVFVPPKVSGGIGRRFSGSCCSIWQSVRCTQKSSMKIFDCIEGGHLCSVAVLWLGAFHSPHNGLSAGLVTVEAVSFKYLAFLAFCGCGVVFRFSLFSIVVA